MSTTMTVILLVATNPACALLGFLFGRITRATVDIADSVTEEGTEMPDKEKRRVGRTNPITIISVVVVLIGLITAIVGYQVTRNQDRIVGCVVGYSNASADAFEQRADAQREVNDQLANFMRAVRDAFSSAPADGRKKVFDAVEDFVKADDEAKRIRGENPLPEAPRDACAELLD